MVLDPMAVSLMGGIHPDDVTPDSLSPEWWSDPEPAEAPRTVAPEVVRYIPRQAMWEADQKQKADDWATNARASMAEKWAATMRAQLELDAQTEIEKHADYTDGPVGPVLEPQRAPDTLTAGWPEPRNLLERMQRWGANQSPEGGAGSVVNAVTQLPGEIISESVSNMGRSGEELMARQAGTSTGAEDDLVRGTAEMALGGPPPAKVSAFGKAAHELVRPGADAIEMAFNAAPVKGAGIRERVSDALSGIERQITDRFADLNKLGQTTEALVANMGGANEGALQRVADDLGPAYQAVQEDLPKLNKLVGLQNFAEEAAAKGGARQGPGGLTDAAQARQAIIDLEAEVGPDRWARLQQADHVRRLAVNNLRDDLEASGIISPDLIKVFKNERADYNPIVYTKFLEKLADGTAGRTMRQMSNTVRKLSKEGGVDEQLPPMQALTKAIMDGDMAIRRNDVVRSVVTDGGFTAEKMPLTFTTGPVIKSESGNAVGELGTVVNRQTPKNLNGYVYFMENGVPMRAAVPPTVEKAMNGLTADQLTMFQKVGEFINRSLRMGATTLNPSFLASNMTSDYMTSMVREGLLPQEVAKGYLDVLTRSPEYRAFIRGGGGFGDMGGYFTAPTKAMGLADIEKSITAGGGGTVHNLAELTKLTQAIASGDGVAVAKELARLGPLRDVGEVLEKGPRVATYKKAIDQGASAEEATMRGRRVTVDFNRAGQFMKTANAWIPFLNPAFQGGLNLGRSLRDNPNAKFRAAGISAAAIGTYLYNRQFGAAYDDIPDFEKNRGIVIMLPGAEANENGVGFKKNPHILIPIRDLAAFTLPVEAVLRKWDGHDPQLLDVLSRTALALNPLPSVLDPGSMMPAPLREAMAQKSNYDTFRGRPIVSRGTEDLPPEMQYGARTSEAAKALGAKLKLSPDRIDHFVEGLTAGAGTKVMQAASTLMGQESDRAPVIGGLASGVYRTYGGQIENDLYKEADKIYTEHRDEALEIARTSPAYESATPDERLRIVRSADTALRTAVNESVGIEKGTKDYGLPNRYRGVEAGSQLEQDIARAFNVAEDKRTLRDRSLVARYEGKENPAYSKATKARAADTKTTSGQVRELVGAER